MSLRVIATMVISLLLVLALGTAASLVWLTQKQAQTGVRLGAAIESVRAAEELEVSLLAHNRECIREDRSNEAVADLEQDLQQDLGEIHLYVETATEADLVEEVGEKISAYLEAQRAAETAGHSRAAMDAVLGHLDRTYQGLESLTELNVAQAHEAQQDGQRWNRIANVSGIAISTVLAIGAASLLIWVWGFALRPAFELARAMERFSSGDRAARAKELGAREMREMASRFNEMASALERERENQLTFLSSVAHDLRNPLSALRMSAALADGSELRLSPEQVRKTLSLVGRQVESLERMVGDLLDSTRIEAGHLDLQIEERDARSLAREVVEVYWAGDVRPLTLAVPERAIPIACDPTRIEQVLHNLVSNAIKYSPASSPIHISVTRDGREAVFSVADRGIGIPNHELGRIFEPFRRTATARDVASGVGLGLSVARRIIEAHCGRIQVESTPGRGSTFRVRVPLAAEPLTAQVVRPPYAAEQRA